MSNISMQSLKIHNKLKMKYENNALDTLDFEIDTVRRQIECTSASTDTGRTLR